MSATGVVLLEECTSTQQEALNRLEAAADSSLVIVQARRQMQGRGRNGRVWQDPPGGGALLLSVARRGPLDVAVLNDLPRRCIEAVIEAAASLVPTTAGLLAWDAPNDLIAAGSGAKVGGVLVDARTRLDEVEHVVIGMGVNVQGGAFVTDDGRAATTLEQACGASVEVDQLRDLLVASITSLLSP